MVPERLGLKEAAKTRFGLKESRAQRALDRNVDRKSKRHEAFATQRYMKTNASEEEDNKPLKGRRNLALEKWKKEKEMKKKMLKDSQRPAFKVGVVKHRIYSPVSVPLPKSAQKKKSTVSSAKKKREANMKPNLVPDNFQFKAPKGVTAIPLAHVATPIPTRSKQARINFLPLAVHGNGAHSQNSTPRPKTPHPRDMMPLPKTPHPRNTPMPKTPHPRNTPLPKIPQPRNTPMTETKASSVATTSSKSVERVMKIERLSRIGNGGKPKKTAAMPTSGKRVTRSQVQVQEVRNEKTVVTQVKAPTSESATTTDNMIFADNQDRSVDADKQTDMQSTIDTDKENILECNTDNYKTPRRSSIKERLDKTPESVFAASRSPFVTTVRGKKGSASYTRSRASAGGFVPVTISEPFTPTGSTSTRNKTPTKSFISTFRTILENEIYSLHSLCDQWINIQETVEIPEHASEMIDVVVGLTNLLINEKLAQFGQLITDCELGNGDHIITESDLQGFWDMVYMQVTDVNNKFSNLVELQLNNWEEKIIVKAVRKKVGKKRRSNKRRSKTAQSSLRAVVAAARKKKKELEAGEAENTDVLVDSSDPQGKHPKFDAPLESITGNLSSEKSRHSTPGSKRKSLDVYFTPVANHSDSLYHVALSKSLKARKSLPLSSIDVNSLPRKGILKSTVKLNASNLEGSGPSKERRKSLRSSVKFQNDEDFEKEPKQKFPTTPLRNPRKNLRLSLMDEMSTPGAEGPATDQSEVNPESSIVTDSQKARRRSKRFVRLLCAVKAINMS